MEFENDFSLKEWAKDKPLSILQLDPADRAVLRIAGRCPPLNFTNLGWFIVLLINTFIIIIFPHNRVTLSSTAIVTTTKINVCIMNSIKCVLPLISLSVYFRVNISERLAQLSFFSRDHGSQRPRIPT